jgi:tellurite resistance protein
MIRSAFVWGDQHVTALDTAPAPVQTAAAPQFASVPASFFGIVLGLAGLGGAWRAAHLVWDLPAWVGEALMVVAGVVWTVLVVLYALKWTLNRSVAVTELGHPVQCCFVGLAGVSTMLVAGGALPYHRLTADILFALGALFTLAFAVWRTGGLWGGGRDPTGTTAVLYLPTVAGSFVTGTLAATLGWPDWGQLAFGSGLFSWLAIESVLLHRLLTGVALVQPLRPTLGIQLAPAPVGAICYLSVAGGAPDWFAHALVGYGLLQALVLVRLLPWIWSGSFTPAYWAFTFGATALATAPLRLLQHGDEGAVAVLAPVIFAAANLVVAVVAAATLRLAVKGRLLPAPAPTNAPPGVQA